MTIAETSEDEMSYRITGKLPIVDITESTNDDVAALGKTGAPNGTAMAAHAQRSGRRRRRHR
jgi:BirA family biotin operon repressor/biotin-[acetyl-CoA-carboxylase] ligase